MPKIIYEAKNFTNKTLAVIHQAEDIIIEYQAQGFSLTLRQVYYQFVARGFIENTERDYKRLGNIISDARRAGMIDWDAIEDRTRYLRSVSSWDSPQSILGAAKESYHRDLWESQDVRFEVWIEKDALVGVIQGVCEDLDVPYFSCRGYVSDSEMWQAGMRVHEHNRHGQRVVMLHLGDHDPSGIDMTRDIKSRIELFSAYGDFEMKRIALTMEQIEDQSPPPNPAKISDSRFAGYEAKYGDESWELDALEPSFIVELIEESVFALRDDDLYEQATNEQEKGRVKIGKVIDQWDKLF